LRLEGRVMGENDRGLRTEGDCRQNWKREMLPCKKGLVELCLKERRGEIKAWPRRGFKPRSNNSKWRINLARLARSTGFQVKGRERVDGGVGRCTHGRSQKNLAKKKTFGCGEENKMQIERG